MYAPKAQPPAPQGGAEAKEKDRSEQKEPAAKPPERKEGGFFAKLKSVFSSENKQAKSAAENKSVAAGTSSSATTLGALGGANHTVVHTGKSLAELEQSAKDITKLSRELMGLHEKQQKGFISEVDTNRIKELRAELPKKIQDFRQDFKEYSQLDIKVKSPEKEQREQRLEKLRDFNNRYIDIKDEHGLPYGDVITRMDKRLGRATPIATTPQEPRPVSPHRT
jgi:hypothetical protein